MSPPLASAGVSVAAIFAATCAAVFTASAPASALAQPKPYDADQASVDFAGGDFAHACPYFASIDRIAPTDDFQVVKHSIDQFACFVRLGLGFRADKARGELEHYYEGKPEPDAARAQGIYLARFRTYRDALTKSGPSIVVDLPSGLKDVVVTRSGPEANASALPIDADWSKPVLIDAGTYHVVWRQGDETVADQRDVTVANPFADGKLDHASAPVHATPKAGAQRGDPSGANDAGATGDLEVHRSVIAFEVQSGGPSKVGIALVVSGGAVIALGAVLVGVAGAKASGIPGSCDHGTLTCANDADTKAANDASSVGAPLLDVGIGAFAVGGALVVSSVIAFATGGSKHAAAKPDIAAVWLAPWGSAERGGLVAGGAF